MRKKREEPASPEEFLRALAGELSDSIRRDHPLSVLALRLYDSPPGESVRGVLDALRSTDLVCRPGPREVIVGLPKTTAKNARVVAARLREAVPGVAFGVATLEGDETAENLVEKARAGANAAGPVGAG